MNSNKPFSQSLFDSNDMPARQAIQNYFQIVKNISFVANSNRFDVDLVNTARNIGLELECRAKWNGEHYPYQFVNVLRRKKALFDGSHDLANYLFILNSTFDKAIGIKPADIRPYITDENCHEIECFIAGDGWRRDFVYKIPLSAFKEISLNWIIYFPAARFQM